MLAVCVEKPQSPLQSVNVARRKWCLLSPVDQFGKIYRKLATAGSAIPPADPDTGPVQDTRSYTCLVLYCWWRLILLLKQSNRKIERE